MTNSTNAASIHPFEKRGLGRAPFRCVGFYESKYQAIPGDPSCPIQPGSTAAGRALLESNRERLAGLTVFDGRYDRNALERIEWLLKNAGRAGKLRAISEMERLLAA